ncbi:MAG: sn-glycerol-3-phosphate ABC transporter ATP-binding protein UgpC [Actinobacteria bacterium]|nr:sn-glycerol-3-phosphate ABC transporter ATP-binding protein UgpC [Actinomycetota bacterium]
MAEVVFEEVSKFYDNGVEAVSQLSLRIADGEFLALVGPSGCGKSTALRLVAGLEDVSSGRLIIDGRIANDETPGRRNVAMVFQNYALYPHMTVERNIELSLKIRRMPKAERRAKVREVAHVLGIDDLLDRKPAKLSGGQRQRVAMGRAIVRDPAVFLLDEPLSNLDAKLRVQMRAEIRELQRRLHATTIFVTHDQIEAMTMADRVAVMRRGVLQQVGSPQELYERPANLFVADFIGSPAMNFLEGRLASQDGETIIQYSPSQAELRLPNRITPPLDKGRNVILGIRPEHLRVVTESSEKLQIPATVVLTETMGAETLVHVSVPAPAVVTEELIEVLADIDETALEKVEDPQANRFTIRVAGSSVPDPGSDVRLLPDPERLLFFDPTTGKALA